MGSEIRAQAGGVTSKAWYEEDLQVNDVINIGDTLASNNGGNSLGGCKIFCRTDNGAIWEVPITGIAISYKLKVTSVADNYDPQDTTINNGAPIYLISFEKVADEHASAIGRGAKTWDVESLGTNTRLIAGDMLRVSNNARLFLSYSGETPWETSRYFTGSSGNVGEAMVERGDWVVSAIEISTDENGRKVYTLYLIPYEAPSNCNHTYEWSLEVDATATEDGLEAYRCTQCGHVAAYAKTSAAGAFVKETLEKIIKAKAGDTLLIETDRWTCFPQSVMQTIADRRNITITIQYKLAGTKYQITIPADAAVPTDVPYAGFDEYLAGLYGKEEVVK